MIKMSQAPCEICSLISSDTRLKVYEDDKVVAFLNPTPASLGHISLVPKKHYTIIDQVPDYIVNYMFVIAYRLSILLFESLNAQGTNIIVNNGIPAGQTDSHLIVHIIPRRKGDGLGFQWQPKQLSQEELSTIELKINEFTKLIGKFDEDKKEAKPAPEKPAEIKDEDYLLQRLRKIP